MTQPAPAQTLDDSADAGVVASFVTTVLAVVEAELKKLRRDPTDVFTRAVQPLLWLVVFGQVFGRLRAVPTGGLAYLDFLAPGILAQSVLFTAIFYGIAIIWERDLGILHTMLVSPAPRSALVVGKAFSASMRALAQAVLIYFAAFALGVHLSFNALSIAGVLAGVALGAAIFSTFSLCVACIVKTRERFMGIGQVLTMPLFFASSAIYPVAAMPSWLQVVARVNPLTYAVDLQRALMIEGGTSTFGVGLDFAVQGAVFVGLVVVAAKLYPTVVR